MAQRITVVAALCAAFAVVAVMLLSGGGGSYRVQAVFENASQLVKGDQVETGGVPIGTVESIKLTRNRLALVTLRVTDPDHRPLREGTQAIVRQMSLTGVANRYVDLRLPGGRPRAIPDGGTIDTSHTTSAVDLDQLFDTFDPKTRRALSTVIRGQGRQWAGAGRYANAGLLYLNPTIASSTRLLDALDANQEELDRFVVSSAHAASDLASRRNDLAGLVDHLSTAFGAVDQHRGQLSNAIGLLPRTLRTSNTTLVNLRHALDDLQPAVDAAKPLVAQVTPFTNALADFTRAGRPTLSRLASVMRRPGRDNDLVELLRRLGPLRDAAVRPLHANAATRPSTFSTAANALAGLTPEIAFARPYSVDATGWFDDFAHSGVYDALGGTGRIAFHSVAYANVGGSLSYVPPALRGAVFDQVAQRDQRDRCPGSMERGTAYKPTPAFNCDLRQVPPGP